MKQQLNEIFQKTNTITVMVVGDFMLDAYIFGVIERISPEAPVPIVNVSQQRYLPGGAGNVVLNLQALGANVIAVGCIGSDNDGKTLRQGLVHEKINLDLLWQDSRLVTSVKQRILASSQQLLRIDFEKICLLPTELEVKLLAQMLSKIAQVDIVAVSDYQKGLLSPFMLRQLIAKCKEQNVPIIIDPKSNCFKKYRGATVLKPNLKEAYAAAVMDSTNALTEVAEKLLQQTQVDALIITRSEQGISLFKSNQPTSHFPALVHQVKDVTGAGDTVLAILAFALAHKISMPEAIELANFAASIAIEKIGCVQVSLAEMSQRFFKKNIDNKIIHVSSDLPALKYLVQTECYIVICLREVKSITPYILQQIEQMKEKYRQHDLIIHVQTQSFDNQLLLLLAALSAIDWIVTDLEVLHQITTPKAILLINDEEHRYVEVCDFETILNMK